MNNEFNQEIDGLKPSDMSRLRLPWYKKIILKFFPRLFFKMFAKEIGAEYNKIKLANKLFGNVRRIDIQPLAGGQRGFIIFIDNKLSLWFYQDGDHFTFDGFETGEYDDGDVIVFDKLG